MTNASADANLTFLRHVVATIAYRGGKTLRGAPAGFAEFRVADGTRTPGAILAHVGDLLEWTLRLAQGGTEWRPAAFRTWEAESARFFAALAALDAFLATGMAPGLSAERLFQGPLADALTHVGQIAMLRRLAGSPVRGELMIRAEVVAGRVGPEQAAPFREFD